MLGRDEAADGIRVAIRQTNDEDEVGVWRGRGLVTRAVRGGLPHDVLGCLGG